MAIIGHGSIAEVERYTREAGRTKLADGAMAKFKPRRQVPHLAAWWDKKSGFSIRESNP
jgi:hypothetical protein